MYSKEVMDVFPHRLRLLRENKKMTQEEVAQSIGTTKNTVYCWETGKKSPSMQFIISLADLFDCSSDYLLGRTDIIFTQKETPPALAEGMKRSEITLPDDGLPTTRAELERFVRSVLRKDEQQDDQ